MNTIKKRICWICGDKIVGFLYERYMKNTIIKPQAYCMNCWNKAGQPKREKLSTSKTSKVML